MSNLLVLPILIPLCTAVILIFLKERIRLQRWISSASGLLNIVIAAVLVSRVHDQGIQTLQMGDGPRLTALCSLAICWLHCCC